MDLWNIEGGLIDGVGKEGDRGDSTREGEDGYNNSTDD